ncbi:MAG TPA: hypothetical protein VGO75_15675 [Gemmatimonadaceae bacterium]|nr:hypothetical protein [Gemmatimonadaceae bacterium]
MARPVAPRLLQALFAVFGLGVIAPALSAQTKTAGIPAVAQKVFGKPADAELK